ncbi:MAG TPA: PP2C family serine/threonine-protein phosphatase [Blastocatellia bacterium]|nr:PP2C family serine/threonine-protein phosphatase [Blastocatellia bacterium]
MWKYGFASVEGTFHLKSLTPCQDASRVEVVVDAGGAEVLLAVASDGAGSATLAQIGSTLACSLFVDEVKSHIEGGNTRALLSDNFIVDWVGKFRRTAAGWSRADSARMQDFACTLLAAIVWHDRAIYFQIGDGAIVESRRDEPDRYAVVCWPQQGEYANMTNFLTDADAAEKVVREARSGAIDEVAIFTDGIQRLALDYSARSAHAPFFAPLFAWLRPRPGGYSRELSDSLAVYLNSEKLNSRTDDDKTLILATRR